MDIQTALKIINAIGLILDGTGAYTMIRYTPEITNDPRAFAADGPSVMARGADYLLEGSRWKRSKSDLAK